MIEKEKVNVAADSSEMLKLWHRRLGHRSFSTLKNMQTHQSVIGLPKFSASEVPCDPCGECKLVDRNIPRETQVHKMEGTSPGEKVHIDLTGMLSRGSHDNFHYGLIIVDDFSRYKWVFPLKAKSDAADCITQ